MKFSMELTLDGLVRALRLEAHALAEDIEAGYAGEDGLSQAAFDLPAGSRLRMRATDPARQEDALRSFDGLRTRMRNRNDERRR